MVLTQIELSVFEPKICLYRRVFGFWKAIFITNSTFSSISAGGFVTKASRFKYPWRLSLSKLLCAFRNFFRMSWVRLTGLSGLSLSARPFKSFDEYALLSNESSLTSFAWAVSSSWIRIEPGLIWLRNVSSVFFCVGWPVPSTRKRLYYLSVATPIQIWFWDNPLSLSPLSLRTISWERTV